LETEKDALLLIAHQTANGAEVDDFKLHLALENGNQMALTTVCRKEMLYDVHNFLLQIATELDTAGVENFLTDVESTLVLLEEASVHILEDIFYCTEINLEIVLVNGKEFSQSAREYLGTFTNINVQVVDFLIQPITDTLDMRWVISIFLQYHFFIQIGTVP
jgi:hypothetical protein